MIHKLKLFYYLGRFNTPFGYLLLMLPSLWGLTLNLQINNIYQTFSLSYLIYLYCIFIVGSILMRAFGCVINDFFDKDIDSKIQRTKKRPFANNSVTTKDGIVFLIILSIIPLVILLTLPPFAIYIGILVLPIVIIYPLTKRFFKAPQLILGIAFNWGILLSSAIIYNEINMWSIILYVASILWTICYDTIYAYQDYEDDGKLKLFSTTQIIKNKAKPVIGVMYIVMAFIILFLGFYYDFSPWYFVLICLAYIYVLFMLKKLNYENPRECFDFFKQNVYFAIIILIGFWVI